MGKGSATRPSSKGKLKQAKSVGKNFIKKLSFYDRQVNRNRKRAAEKEAKKLIFDKRQINRVRAAGQRDSCPADGLGKKSSSAVNKDTKQNGGPVGGKLEAKGGEQFVKKQNRCSVRGLAETKGKQLIKQMVVVMQLIYEEGQIYRVRAAGRRDGSADDLGQKNSSADNKLPMLSCSCVSSNKPSRSLLRSAVAYVDITGDGFSKSQQQFFAPFFPSAHSNKLPIAQKKANQSTSDHRTGRTLFFLMVEKSVDFLSSILTSGMSRHASDVSVILGAQKWTEANAWLHQPFLLLEQKGASMLVCFPLKSVCSHSKGKAALRKPMG